MVPMEMKNLKSHEDFKNKIKDGNLVDVTVNSEKVLCQI